LNKHIRIGSSTALVGAITAICVFFGCTKNSGLGNGCFTTGSAPATAATVFGVVPQLIGENAESSAEGIGVGYITFLLLILAGILLVSVVTILFQLRKRRTAEQQLKVVAADYDLFFNSAPCGYFSIDGQGFFVTINDRLLDWLGYQRWELLGKVKFTDIMKGENEGLFEKVLAMTEESGSKDVDFKKKNESSFPVILQVIRHERNGGDPRKRVYSAIDNTCCKQALLRINNLNQELEAFSYSISHDLRAPLRSVDGYSRILQEDYGKTLDEEGRRVLNVIMNNAKRMGKLIDDLLDFGRLGRKEMQLVHVDMSALVDNIVQELLEREPGRQIYVKVDDLDPAFADADMIRQMWVNLLENAFKYTGKNAEAVIEVRSYKIKNQELCYEIKDNGVGFDMKYAPKLFGVFQRLHKIQDFSGTGVGLAIVKRIITRHGGRVWAEGDLKKGAIFYFTLPIANDNA
jgi:PAS domain S-box-containing protein